MEASYNIAIGTTRICRSPWEQPHHPRTWQRY